MFPRQNKVRLNPLVRLAMTMSFIKCYLTLEAPALTLLVLLFQHFGDLISIPGEYGPANIKDLDILIYEDGEHTSCNSILGREIMDKLGIDLKFSSAIMNRDTFYNPFVPPKCTNHYSNNSHCHPMIEISVQAISLLFTVFVTLLHLYLILD